MSGLWTKLLLCRLQVRVMSTTSCAFVKQAKNATARKAINYGVKASLKPVKVKREMSVFDLANALNKPVEHVYDCVRQLNTISENAKLSPNFTLRNYDDIVRIVKLSGCRPVMESDKEDESVEELKRLDERDEHLERRPKPKVLVKRSPVVTIMGHVDHGKTTLLDGLRNTNVVEKEFGGITQHIGAFNSKLKSTTDNVERSITFLDTPGHAAFMSMRARGAKLTDIIVLVVAADDGVMAQTIESIQLAKESKCSIIIAINKIDKANETQVRKLKQDLIQYGLQTEDTGGDVQCVPISALKRQNVELLKEEIWALAEVLELKGDPTPGLVEGYIIESCHDANRGKLATVILKRGTLRKNAFLVCGTTYCKVKQMMDDQLRVLNEVTLSNAVQIMGWKDLPEVGADVLEVDSEKRAKEVVDVRLRKREIEKLKADSVEIKKKQEEHYANYKEELESRRKMGFRFKKHCAVERKSEASIIDNEANHILSVVIKTDVNGTLEAILQLLDTYEAHDKVKLDVVSFGVGPVTKHDVELANTFGSTIYCFNLDSKASAAIDTSTDNEKKNYKIKHFNIIYRLFDDLLAELCKLAPLVESEEVLGQAELSQVFEINEKKDKLLVGGGRCLDGLIDSKKYFKVTRDGTVVYDREKCKMLKHFKTNVNSIKKGSDFGFSFENPSVKIEKGDKIICYDVKMVRDKIEWALGF